MVGEIVAVEEVLAEGGSRGRPPRSGRRSGSCPELLERHPLRRVERKPPSSGGATFGLVAVVEVLLLLGSPDATTVTRPGRPRRTRPGPPGGVPARAAATSTAGTADQRAAPAPGTRPGGRTCPSSASVIVPWSTSIAKNPIRTQGQGRRRSPAPAASTKADDQRRRDVAEVGVEPARLAEPAGGGQRREHVGDPGDDPGDRQHPHQPAAAPDHGGQTSPNATKARITGQSGPSRSSRTGKKKSCQTSGSL